MHWPDEEAATLPNAIPIRRCSGLTPEATMREHLCGEGLPVVVTDAQQDWQARKLWSFAYFARRFGDQELLVNDRAPFRPDDDPPNQTLRISMREYVRYLTEAEPHGHSLAARERGFPFYGNSWAPFNAEPELADAGLLLGGIDSVVSASLSRAVLSVARSAIWLPLTPGAGGSTPSTRASARPTRRSSHSAMCPASRAASSR